MDDTFRGLRMKNTFTPEEREENENK